MRWVVALFLVAQAAQPPAGRVTVAAVDSSGYRMPGVSITLRSGAGERTGVTGPDGTHTFDNVPPGRYAAVARLQGFYVEPATGIIVSAAHIDTAQVTLTTDCIKMGEGLDRGLAWAARQADVIAHLRISPATVDDACAIESHCTCTLHRAEMVRGIKGRTRAGLRFIQEDAGYTGPQQPYRAGDELIVFLKWDDANQTYMRIAESRYAYPVRDGRLPDGQTVDAFASTVRGPLLPQPSGHLTGTVVDPSGTQLSGVHIYAHSFNGFVSAVTDRAGGFEFRDLPAGAYTLWAQAAGFEAAPSHADVRPGENTRVNLTLKRR